MAFSHAFAKEIQDHINNITAHTAPATKTLRAYTTTPGADGTGGVEVSETGYSAVTLTMATAWDAAGAANQGTTQNAAEISFGTNAGSTITIVGWGLWNGAQLDEYAALTTSRQIQNGDEMKFPADELTRKFA